MSGSLETRFVIIFIINKNSFQNRFFKKNLYPRTQKTHVGKIIENQLNVNTKNKDNGKWYTIAGHNDLV